MFSSLRRFRLPFLRHTGVIHVVIAQHVHAEAPVRQQPVALWRLWLAQTGLWRWLDLLHGPGEVPAGVPAALIFPPRGLEGRVAVLVRLPAALLVVCRQVTGQLPVVVLVFQRGDRHPAPVAPDLDQLFQRQAAVEDEVGMPASLFLRDRDVLQLGEAQPLPQPLEPGDQVPFLPESVGLGDPLPVGDGDEEIPRRPAEITQYQPEELFPRGDGVQLLLILGGVPLHRAPWGLFPRRPQGMVAVHLQIRPRLDPFLVISHVPFFPFGSFSREGPGRVGET